MPKIFRCEDHCEVLGIWRTHRIQHLDLVHLDAHIDFGEYAAEPVERVVADAASIAELKSRLEQTLNYLHYEPDVQKQLNIGNYIYPAIREGIVNDFYWVVPGGSPEFRASANIIRNMLRAIAGRGQRVTRTSSESLRIAYRGRNIVVCTLNSLPVLAGDTLLDIDTDFLVIDSVKNSDNTTAIGRRKPWISPAQLAGAIQHKVPCPRVVTIAYSVNGGWTPLRYKY